MKKKKKKKKNADFFELSHIADPVSPKSVTSFNQSNVVIAADISMYPIVLAF